MGVWGIYNFQNINFSEYSLVRNLILNKLEIVNASKPHNRNDFLDFKVESIDYSFEDEIKELYDRLDEYIDYCNFSDDNMIIIKALFNGVDVDEIARIKNVGSQTIYNRLRRIVLKINNVYENKERESWILDCLMASELHCLSIIRLMKDLRKSMIC